MLPAGDALISSGEEGGLAKPYLVSELVAELKTDVEKKHRSVRVIGEISSYKLWRSGHAYFDIKDENALLPAVMFKPHVARLAFLAADGMRVLVSGRISIYAANARLQMVAEGMEPLGEGALALAFEQLKARLKEEGLFDQRHKKAIKAFNQCIGLVTSSHGAVLSDMVRILRSRMPGIDILFHQVRVQGRGAAEEIASAIGRLDELGACDVIIVGRGGGSLEDLWAFNEEAVARAIFRAVTPIISAVGHETDFSISDLVADVRAATPTHAAAIAVPELHELSDRLRHGLMSMDRVAKARVMGAKLALAAERRRIREPKTWLFGHWQRTDEGAKALSGLMVRMMRQRIDDLRTAKDVLSRFAPFKQLGRKKEALYLAKARMIKLNPDAVIKRACRDVDQNKRLLKDAMAAQLVGRREHFFRASTKLYALSPLSVLRRGYSMVESAGDGRMVRKASEIEVGCMLRIRLGEGAVSARVTAKE